MTGLCSCSQSLNVRTLQRITVHVEGFLSYGKIHFSKSRILIYYYSYFPYPTIKSICVTRSSFSSESELSGYHALIIISINYILCSVMCFIFYNSFCINCTVNGTEFNLPIFYDSCMNSNKSVLSNSRGDCTEYLLFLIPRIYISSI